MINEEQSEENIERDLNEALLSCEKCHFCNTVCPVVDTRVTQGPFGINRTIYYGLKWNKFNEELRDLVYSCTTCGKCDLMCKKVSRALPLTEIIEKARELILEKIGPMPDQKKALNYMHVVGNPWGYPVKKRTEWAEDLGIKLVSKENEVDVLFFVGCVSSYDPQGQRIAQSLSKILKQAGVNFGILEEEKCSGSEARRMGEIGLFEELSEANMEMFEKAGITHIVTGDPHSFYSFTQEYPDRGTNIIFQHSTQVLNELIDKGKLSLNRKVQKKVTYHDPCYLGRRSKVFEEPRTLIQKVPGITLVEMENNREDSNCCGIGGGRMWMEPPKGLMSSQVIAEKRVQQALDTGAEILLTACPFCNINLTDAAKILDKEDTIQILDITELISMAL